MKIVASDLHSEEGIAAIETSMVFMIIFMFIMFTYEFLKYQNDMAAIALYEALAVERTDLALLKSDPEKLSTDFDAQLKALSGGFFFNSPQYEPAVVECFTDLSKAVPEKCSDKTKLIKFTYEVKRSASSEEICELFGLSIVLQREIVTINDYYKSNS